RTAAGHRWKENFRRPHRRVLHGNLHFTAIREPSHILRHEPHYGGAIGVCALRHLSMPESRSRWSSRVYGRNVGEAIGASTGGVKWMPVQPATRLLSARVATWRPEVTDSPDQLSPV